MPRCVRYEQQVNLLAPTRDTGMEESKPIIRQAVVAACTLAAAIVFSTQIAAQEQPPMMEQEELGDTSEQPVQNQLRHLGNTPDNIAAQLFESDERIDAIFSVGPLTPLHNVWDQATDSWRESARLDLGLNYTALYQRADTTVKGPRDAMGGDLDFFGRWLLLGSEDCCPGSLVFSSETRHRYSDIPPADLNTGTVGGTIVSFGMQDFSLVEMYWEQGSYDDGRLFRVGKMDPALIYDGGRYVSSNYAFFSPAFSDTLPMALPGAGLGVAGAVFPTESTYIYAGIHDANGERTTAGFNTFFGEGEYFTAVEFGFTPNYDEPNAGMFHFTLWNIDARQDAGKQSDRGVALTLEQQVGCEGNVVPFLRYAYAHRGINGIRQNLSIGVGLEDMFGKNEDIIGAAISWEDPSDGSLRDQYVFETFYRFYITPHTHLTPDIQVVVDPANAPTKDAVTIFGLRLRTLF
jgi:porin